jgi:hypothetical protein
LEGILVIGGYERNRGTVTSESSGAPYSVDKSFGVRWDIQVYDQIYIFYVYSPCLLQVRKERRHEGRGSKGTSVQKGRHKKGEEGEMVHKLQSEERASEGAGGREIPEFLEYFRTVRSVEIKIRIPFVRKAFMTSLRSL